MKITFLKLMFVGAVAVSFDARAATHDNVDLQVALRQAHDKLVSTGTPNPDQDAFIALQRAIEKYRLAVEAAGPNLKVKTDPRNALSARVVVWETPNLTDLWDNAGTLLEELGKKGLKVALDRVAECVNANYPPSVSPIGLALPDTLKAERGLIEWCRARFRMAWHAGDHAEAVRALRHGLAICRVQAGSMNATQRMSARLGVSGLIELLMGCLSEGVVPKEVYGRLDDVIQEQCGWIESRNHLKVLRIQAIDRYLWSQTEKGRLDWKESQVVSKMVLSEIGFDKLAKALENPADKVAAPLPEDDPAFVIVQVSTAFSDLERVAERVPLHRYRDGWRRSTEADRLGKGNTPLTAIWSQAVGSIYEMEELRARICGARVVLGVEAYRSMNGVVPEDLRAAKVDTILDPLTAEPWRYRTLAIGEDPRNRSYTVYSPGIDGTDHKGLIDADGQGCSSAVSDWVASRGRACDLVANEVRRFARERPIQQRPAEPDER